MGKSVPNQVELDIELNDELNDELNVELDDLDLIPKNVSIIIYHICIELILLFF